MGTVLRFPSERVRGALVPTYQAQTAEIVILPVVQVERATFGFAAVPQSFEPRDNDSESGGRRRRRGPRA